MTHSKRSRHIPVPLRPPRRHAPTVELVETRGFRQVRKSYDRCPSHLKWTVGRLAISREAWALRRLQHSPHTPRFVARPNPWTLVSEFIEGTSLEELGPGQVDGFAVLHETRSLLSDLAQHGVIHGDLGHDHWQNMGRESNLIWTPNGKLVAVDFAGALPHVASGLGGLCEALACHDRLLLTKVQYHFLKESHDWSQTPSEQVRWPIELWDTLRLLGKL